MQPWSVIRMWVMRSRSRFISRDAMRRHHASSRVRAHAADVVGAGVHRGEQLADLLRRVLQVGVERDDALAAHALEAGDDRHVLAVVRVEQHDARHVRPRGELVLQQRGRAVAAAVVDEDHFVGDAERVERRIQPREQRRQPGLLVVDGDDDGELRVRSSVALTGDVAARISAHAAQTRSTSASVMAACSGSVTVVSAIRSVFGRSPR